MRPVLFALALSPALLLTSHASAVGTRTFELDTLEKLSGGDLKGVAIGSDGIVRAGWTLGEVALPDGTASWAAVRLADKSVLVGVTGGKVFRIAGGTSSLFAETGSQAVTSLVVAPNGTVYAGTIPDAKIFKLTQGKADLFATLPEAHNIWALVLDKNKTALFAAAGPDGRIFRVGLDGTASVYLHTDEPNLVSLAVADNGDLLAGSSGKGLLYRVTGAGRAQVIYDFPGDTATEVRGLAVSGHEIFAAVNEYSEAPEPPKRAAAVSRTPASPTTGTRPKPGKGWLYRFDAQGRPEKMMHHDDFHYMTLALDDAGQPFVGTGVEGRVYTVDDAHAVTLVADTDERQVGALLLSGGGSHGPVTGLVASSDPVVAHPIVGRGGADAVWTSKPLDTGLRARFGHLSWRAKGNLELSSRTGDTALPDTTWSEWSGAVAQGGAIASPAARYVQVRARWAGDPAAELSDVVIPFVTENLRAVVTEITATARGVHEGKEGLSPSGAEPPRHDANIKLVFHVDNPDGDELRYRAWFRREAETLWRPITRPDEVLTKAETEWDTSTLSEGKYRVRVVVTDELANPPETTQQHALESSADPRRQHPAGPQRPLAHRTSLAWPRSRRPRPHCAGRNRRGRTGRLAPDRAERRHLRQRGRGLRLGRPHARGSWFSHRRRACLRCGGQFGRRRPRHVVNLAWRSDKHPASRSFASRSSERTSASRSFACRSPERASASRQSIVRVSE